MGIQAVSDDIITAIVDVLDVVGNPLLLNYNTEGVLDPLDPGAGKTKTPVSVSVDGILVDYEDSFIDGTIVKKGDRLAILSVACLEIAVEQGMFIEDDSRTYKIIHAEKPQIAGSTVVVYAQVRG